MLPLPQIGFGVGCGSHNESYPDDPPPCTSPTNSNRCREAWEEALEEATTNPCNRNFASFDEDTLVATKDGLVPIGELEEGDLVLAYNEDTGEVDYYPIEAVLIHVDPIVVYLVIDGELIETTPEHPFYTAGGEWVEAGDLQVGAAIWQADGSPGTVSGLLFAADPRPMYNLSVTDAHTFFIGEGQSLVHNTCTPQPYGGPGGGHHIHAKSAFQGDPNYDANEALALSNADMDAHGYQHGLMTGVLSVK